MTLDIEKIKAAALDVFAPSVPNAEVLELITRLEELQELYASSAFNTNYWKAKAEAAEKDAAKYQELIYAVGRKFPNETRHETALKYIRQMETKGWNAAGKESEK